MGQSETVLLIIIACVAFFNFLAFILYGVDKNRAKNGGWRISEKALFLAALPGSALGALLGMYVFRHKTKHWYFKYGIPAILAVQVVIAGILIWKYV